MSDTQRPRVVIVGAGFGGLEAAKALADAPVQVVLIDRENHHCFQPLLYQVATASLSPADIAWPVRGILRHQANVLVAMAEIDGIDTRARTVHAGDQSLPYDYLVLATGATHAYFGHDEWAGAAPGLKRIDDATAIRRRLLMAFERAELTQDDAERQRLLTFVIVGGGPTGVEMAGAVAEVARDTLARDFRRIDPRTARVILIEAGPRLLAAFPAHLADYAARTLTRMGVTVMTGTAVTDCTAAGVDTKDSHIDAATIVWAAGVAASPVARWLDLPGDRAGRLTVENDLSVPALPEVFVIGDAAAARRPDGSPVPGIAPAAKQMGRHAGRVIAAHAAGKAAPGPFRYRHAGDLATIGRRAAVVKFGRMELTGFIGWAFWCLAHVYFLIGLRSRIGVALDWTWNYITYQRGARLITHRDQSRRDKPPR